MSIFDKIKNAIFGRHAEASEMPPGSAGGANTPATPPGAPHATPSGAAPAPAPTAAEPQPTPAAGPVDVEAIMDKAVKDSGQKLDWRKSIVDTMKALHLDSSLSERKELAGELGYTGDTGDSATMNVWLHKALMKKLAENGGKVPADLTD